MTHLLGRIAVRRRNVVPMFASNLHRGGGPHRVMRTTGADRFVGWEDDSR